jgi:acyl-CoA thioester hydrolase
MKQTRLPINNPREVTCDDVLAIDEGAPVSDRALPENRKAYKAFREITTRWMDNDVYGHVNNAVYYSYFDTAVNQYLIEAGCLDIRSSAVVGFVVETQCCSFSPIAFPDRVTAGLRVAKSGTSSVRYEIGLFRNGDETASAQGHFIHVYVDRASHRPVPLPEALRQALAPLAC